MRAALIALAWALLMAGCAQETIAHQQEEREANRILVLLKQAGLEPTKLKDEGSRELRFNVMVPQEEAASALVVLEDHNLPKSERPDTALMFQESGMIPTSEQERAKRVVGVEGDIVNSLRELPRVVSVEAAVSIPEVDPLRDVNEERPKPKASVVLVYQPDQNNAPPLTAADVQKHVQAKLPELRSKEVNVLLIPSNEAANGGGGQNGGGVGSAPPIDPTRGCVEKEKILGIDVCKGNKKKVINIMLIALVVAGVLAALVVVAVLRAMRYRKDLTRLTAQFQGLK